MKDLTRPNSSFYTRNPLHEFLICGIIAIIRAFPNCPCSDQENEVHSVSRITCPRGNFFLRLQAAGYGENTGKLPQQKRRILTKPQAVRSFTEVNDCPLTNAETFQTSETLQMIVSHNQPKRDFMRSQRVRFVFFLVFRKKIPMKLGNSIKITKALFFKNQETQPVKCKKTVCAMCIPKILRNVEK